MATGADIPPELFRRILEDVCEDAYRLLDPYTRTTVPNRKEAIRNVTACSLTCVYWAQVCRKQLYQSVSIKNYEDMRAFAQLVSNTPTRFRPISEHVFSATLVQRVGDRPWLHLIRMQPSLFQFWSLLHSNNGIWFHIENSQNDATSLQSSMSHRLFASLPRIPPSSCLQCATLTIDKPHFVTPHDLVSFLQKFSRFDYLRLTNVAWSAQADFASDVLVRHPLNMSSRGFNVVALNSKYTLETVWLALITILRYPFDERRVELQVLPSAQRVILDISRCLCQGHEAPFLRFFRHYEATRKPIGISLQDTEVYRCCNMEIEEYEPTNDRALRHETELAFYGSQMAIPATDDGNFLAVDGISVLCVRIQQRKSSTAGYSSNERPNPVASPWPEIVRLCAAQPGFMQLQLLFESHNRLVQFMEAQRAALGKLDGRVALFYWNKEKTSHELRAADFETLADLGDAYVHDYIRTH